MKIESIFSLIIGIVVGWAITGSYFSHNYNISTENPEPKIEYVYIEKEPEVVTEYIYLEPEKEYVYVPYEEFYRNLTTEDEWYYKDLAMREAEGEGVIGMLWVMYTAECRCEAFGNTISQEWGSSAYTSMNRSGLTPNENCNRAFELFREGWKPKPLYFARGYYHSFANDLCQVGNHCFSY